MKPHKYNCEEFDHICVTMKSEKLLIEEANPQFQLKFF